MLYPQHGFGFSCSENRCHQKLIKGKVLFFSSHFVLLILSFSFFLFCMFLFCSYFVLILFSLISFSFVTPNSIRPCPIKSITPWTLFDPTDELPGDIESSNRRQMGQKYLVRRNKKEQKEKRRILPYIYTCQLRLCQILKKERLKMRT